MISAFKHIRLSGYNLTPVQSAAWDNSSTLRLGFGNSGLAYYSELTGISGYLKSLIDVADANVNSVNNLSGNIYITGGDGITIDVNSSLGEIRVVGNSGYFQALSNEISSNLALTGSNLYNLFSTFSGSSSANIIAISGQLAATGSLLDNKIDSLSGYVNTQDSLLSERIVNTGSIGVICFWIEFQKFKFQSMYGRNQSCAYNSYFRKRGCKCRSNKSRTKICS
jgi:hypothetical protein